MAYSDDDSASATKPPLPDDDDDDTASSCTQKPSELGDSSEVVFSYHLDFQSLSYSLAKERLI